MADEPISALTLFTSYSTADEVEILDVSDTTFASTGTNKRIPFSTLLTMAGVGTRGGAAVGGGGTGLAALGTADQLLGVTHIGATLEYKTLTAGSNVTITPAAGSITMRIASPGAVQARLRVSVSRSHPSSPSRARQSRPLERSPEPSPPRRPIPTSLARPVAQQQLHRSAPCGGGSPSITYGAIQNESASTFLGNPTGSPASPSEIGLYPNLGFVGSSLRGSVPIWAATGPGTALVSSSALTSILTGHASIGSLTIPANRLQIGNRLRFALFGAFRYHHQLADANCQALLGGTVIGQGTSSAAGASIRSTMDVLRTIVGHYCSSDRQERQDHRAIPINLPNFFGLSLNSSGSGTGAPSQVTINTTTSLAIDVQDAMVSHFRLQLDPAPGRRYLS